MIYRVIITPEAETDLRMAYRYIRSYARMLRDWFRRARQSARSLARRPERCPLAPESAFATHPRTARRRELPFCVGCIVYVVHVRHVDAAISAQIDDA